MSKLERKLQKIFAEDSQSTQVTAFRTAGTNPTYTKDVSEIQNVNFTRGWLDPNNTGNVIPYAEDMNGLFYTLSRNIAYLNQSGIPEWLSTETYYENAMCMYNGVLYISLADNNLGKQPDTQTSYWRAYASPVSGSVTGGENLGTGEGIYKDAVGGIMQFKGLVAGSNITLTPSADGTSITIDSTGGGGSGSVAWGDIIGSLASQVDLSTALSQRGTLSGANTWTGNNTFNKILPVNGNSTIGDTNNLWTIYQSYIVGDETFYFSYEDQRVANSRFLLGLYGGEMGLFPAMSSQDNYKSSLGSAAFRWDYLYTDNASINSAYITTISSVGTIVSPYDYQGNRSRIALSYNPPVLGGSPTQWGWMGYLSSSYIGLFPSTTETGSLGSPNNIWKEAYIKDVCFSANNKIADDPNSTGLYIGWRNSSNVGRYVRFAEDAVHPVGVSVVGMTLGTAGDKWDTVYTNNINLNGTNYNKIPVIPTGTIGASYYNLLGTNSNGSLDKSSNFYFSGDSLFLSSTVRLRAESTNVGEFYWYNTTANETATLQLSGDCIRAYSGSQAGKIDLGNPYGYWRDLYLGVGRNIFFYGGSSINDTTGNTLDFHALTQFRFYVGNSEFIYCGSGQFTPTSPSPVNLGSNGSRWNTIYYVALNPPSDIRLKENIEPLDSGLKIVNGLDIKSFTFKNSPDHIEYGIVAQDVVEKYPELISVPDSEEGTYGTYLHNFIFASLRAIQELSAKVENLENQLKELRQ